jgi:mannosyltransferase OCH1-like enzyme
VLWDDENILELFDEFPTMLKIYNIEPTYNGKSDLLRYLILYKYGGIYVDADTVWVNKKSFNNLLLTMFGQNYLMQLYLYHL